MDKEILKQIWDGLTKGQQAACLKQAESGECESPKEIPYQMWIAVTHYLKNSGLARVAHIEGGECEAIGLTGIGKALLSQMNEKTTACIPKELDNDNAKKYFARAINLGLMSKNYEWGKTLGLLSRFAERMSRKLGIGKGIDTKGNERISWQPFEELFNIEPGTLRNNLNQIKQTGVEPLGYEILDEIFY